MRIGRACVVATAVSAALAGTVSAQGGNDVVPRPPPGAAAPAAPPAQEPFDEVGARRLGRPHPAPRPALRAAPRPTPEFYVGAVSPNESRFAKRLRPPRTVGSRRAPMHGDEQNLGVDARASMGPPDEADE